MKHFFKKEKKALSYVEAHNEAYRSYRKSSRIMIWAGVFNFAALLVTIIQYASGTSIIAYFSKDSFLGNSLPSTNMQYCLGFASTNIFNRLLETVTFSAVQFPFWAYCLITFGIAIIFSVAAILCSVYASYGKKWAFYLEVIFYLVDSLLIIANYLLGEVSQYLWIMFGLHVIILFFLGVAIYQYFNIYNIEALYKNKKE